LKLLSATTTPSRPPLQLSTQDTSGIRKWDITESTRGIFISISGYRPEVIASFGGKGANIIFFDGEDLTHILEGRIDIKDALDSKIEKCAQYGTVFVPIKNFLS